MNEIYHRICKLFNLAGINITDGSPDDGEAYAYAAGLQLIKQVLDRAVAKAGIDGSDGLDLRYYAALLGLDPSRYTKEALMAAVIARLSHSYADYTAPQVVEAFAAVGSGSMHLYNHLLTFADVHPEDLPELGKFLASFLYCGTQVAYDGDGMTFDEWEAGDYSFTEYEQLQLPFTILDNYRRTS